MRKKDELTESEYEYVEEEEEEFNIISDKDEGDNESISSELSETIKLREELPFTQLSPYKSDILKLLIENDLKKETSNTKLKTNNNNNNNHNNNNHNNNNPFVFKKKRVLFKEIHNETIGDIYYEFVRIFSFLFFSVFLKDPSYDRYQLDLAKKNDEEISFIIKYFKFRLRTLRKEEEEEKDREKECNSKENINDEDEEEEERLITSKILPLLSVLREKVIKL
ncbi:hypothetical protein HANVADRAFT_54130 [Hanseniaspora valbyensis NRRL Y-1626]|uniref:Uncharacterized protein n=1 Tax=Hanseniaspora valbyensis NRRL Y-1626 TaxID=766949 RepID=A0A1B7T8M6_9ASCO|nr:hypothetical protein HANVADRAFT_54130 [Hanseniaspora valbyensis NRRL Y-1626]